MTRYLCKIHIKLSILLYRNIHVIIVVFFFLTRFALADPIYAMDNINEIAAIKKDLTYWQDDLQGLLDMYKQAGYKDLNESELSEWQRKDKASLEQSIKDGRANVSSSLKQLNENAATKPSSLLGKRESESSTYNDNKRQS